MRHAGRPGTRGGGLRKQCSRSGTRSRTSSQASALRALTRSALGLAGIAGAASADTPVDHISADYNYSIYGEDALDSSKGLAGAEDERYEVEMHQFVLRAPIPWTERLDFGVDVVHETMSGASPWFIVPDAAGSPIQVMSGATIEDERLDVLVQGNYSYDRGRLGLSSGFSTENDYESRSFSIDGETHFNEKNTTLSGGLGVSFDEITPTDASLFSTRPSSEDKQSYTLTAGLSQLIDRRSMIQSGLTYKYSTGYLSDPYKALFVVGGGNFLPDVRPDTRHQLSWLTRYRRHIEEVEASIHADYQFYMDDWDITSHTVALGWHQTLWDGFKVVPSVRYYSQSEADFYIPYFATAPAVGTESSADYRLSAYGALTFGLKAEYVFRWRWTGPVDWRATLSWERYVSSADLSLSGGSSENPGLVSFNVLSVGLTVAY